MEMRSVVTRRRFVEMGGLLLGGLALQPSPVFAADGYTPNRCIELEGSSEARVKWADAVKRAEREGGIVQTGIEGLSSENAAVPISNSRTVSLPKEIVIGLVTDVVTIAANYGVTTENRISPFNWARIYCSASSVASSYYDRAVLDGGRTNAIRYHAEIKGVGGWPTYVGDFYAEFYYTFTGSFS